MIGFEPGYSDIGGDHCPAATIPIELTFNKPIMDPKAPSILIKLYFSFGKCGGANKKGFHNNKIFSN